MSWRRYVQGAAVVAAACGLVASRLALPALAADFYAGKTIDLIVGASPGGGYDIYARAVSRHLAKHIPGEPTIVVKNMPGAPRTTALSPPAGSS